MAVVQYYAGDSFIHRLDPRAKLISLLLLTILIFACTDIRIIFVILVGVLLGWRLAALPTSILGSYSKILAPLLVILIAMQAVFYPGQTKLVDPLIPEFIPLLGGLGHITREGIWFGFVLSVRLLALIVLMPLITFTTPVERLALGLIKMGLPYTIAYTATTALNMIPIMQSELGYVMDAQRLRAFRVFEEGSFTEKVKAYPALVVPLVVGSMRSAQSMGVAMDSRAFGAKKTRTFLVDISFQWYDWVFLACVIALVVGGLVLNII